MKHYFTPLQLNYLREISPGRSSTDCTRLLNEQFGLQLNPSQIRACKKNHGITSGIDLRFVKGHESWNKGSHFKAGGRSAETRFKSGSVPYNWVPVGSERVNGEGYLDVKTAEPRTWKAKHRLMWEASHGKIPKGHAVIFADGDKKNITLENLLLVTRKQLAVLNKQKLIFNDTESTKTGLVIADVLMAARRRQAGGKRE